MKYKFIKFKSKYSSKYKGGLTIGKQVSYILERDYSAPKRMDIYIDYKNNVLKIVKGKDYALCLVKNKRKSHYLFSSGSLVKSGVKTGHYKYLGNGIFKLLRDIS